MPQQQLQNVILLLATSLLLYLVFKEQKRIQVNKQIKQKAIKQINENPQLMAISLQKALKNEKDNGYSLQKNLTILRLLKNQQLKKIVEQWNRLYSFESFQELHLIIAEKACNNKALFSKEHLNCRLKNTMAIRIEKLYQA